MPRTQVEILIESIANLQLQLSAALARESELREANESLANALNDLKPLAYSSSRVSHDAEVERIVKQAETDYSAVGSKA